jgi:hypothetical protein
MLRVAAWFFLAGMLVSCADSADPLLYRTPFVPDSIVINPGNLQFSPADGNRDSVVRFNIKVYGTPPRYEDGKRDVFTASVRSVLRDSIIYFPLSIEYSDLQQEITLPVRVKTTSNDKLEFILAPTLTGYSPSTTWRILRDIAANPGQPPVIESITFPDTVKKPASGSTAVLFRVRVSDPDGRSNIQRVEFFIFDMNGNAVAGSQQLLDDGSPLSGDAAAGDGEYTRALTVDASNTARSLRLRFSATDRTGQKSQVIERIFTISE